MNKNVKVSNPMKVITGPDTRWSYANVWEPKSINGGTPKYSVSLIIPSLTQRLLPRLKLQSKLPTRKVKASLRVTVNLFLLFLSSRLRFVMETLKDLMMQLMPMHTL